MVTEVLPNTQQLRERYVRSEDVFKRGMGLFLNDMCVVMTRKGDEFTVLVEDRFDDFEVNLNMENEPFLMDCNCSSGNECCTHKAAALLHVVDQLEEEAQEADDTPGCERYSREEMIQRVLKERKDRAEKEEYQVSFGDNIFGFHEIRTTMGKVYELTIRDFETSNGYCSCPDYKTNKLGTCKHLIFLNNMVKLFSLV